MNGRSFEKLLEEGNRRNRSTLAHPKRLGIFPLFTHSLEQNVVERRLTIAQPPVSGLSDRYLTKSSRQVSQADSERPKEGEHSYSKLIATV